MPDKSRSIKGGAFVHDAFRYDKNGWHTQMLHSVALHFGFDLDMPFKELCHNTSTSCCMARRARN